MAYNNIFPMNYQPQQMYYPQGLQQNNQQTQNNNMGLTWVQGLEAAKSYLVAPNTTVILFDTERETIYLKSADISGMPSIKILDYSMRNETPQKTARDSYSEFATKVDVESIEKKIVALNERVDSILKKGDEINE